MTATTTSSEKTLSSALADTVLQNDDRGNPASSSTNNNSNNSTTATESSEQLSQDLALFLQNPSLRTALADGSLDLTQYSDKVHEECQTLEAACLQLYQAQAPEIATLQQDVHDCQVVLQQWHEVLLGFQADLGGLSVEIRQLQEKSKTLNVQLQNRTTVQHALSQFLQNLVIAPSLVETIVGDTHPVNSDIFVQACRELQHLYHNAHANTPQDSWAFIPGTPPQGIVPAETTVCKDELQEQLTSLRWHAVQKIRTYFLHQLSLLRQPHNTNIRMMQVHGLVQYRSLQQFVQHTSPEIAHELYNVYGESMSATLLQLFRTYHGQLLQLDATKNITRHDVLAMDDAWLRDTFTTKAKKRTTDYVFSLGTRAVDCLQADATPINVSLVKLQQQQQQSSSSSNKELPTKYPYERLYKSLVAHLVDAVTNEHVVCRQFFQRDAFQLLFQPTISFLLEELENYLFTCYDAVGLLLLIKVTHYYKRIVQQRQIVALGTAFLDPVTQLTWPRLKIIMEGHLRSLKQTNAQKLGGVDLHPHYISRRFGEFVCSILLILQDKTSSSSAPGNASTSTGSSIKSPAAKTPPPIHRVSSAASENSTNAMMMSAGEKLLQDVAELQDEFILLLERLADEHSSQKKKIVFTINNLDQVVSIFQERRVVGPQFNQLVQKLYQQREYFVDVELLSTGFSQMIAFCQQTEAALAETDSTNSAKSNPHDLIQPAQVEALVLDFASHWKANMEVINRNVLSYFSNFRNGMEILKQVLTQLLLYYTRFQELLRKVWPKNHKKLPFAKDLVPTSVILAEIKKYALAI